MSRSADIEKYILQHSTPPDEVLQELERETYLKMLNPRMISGQLQGQLLTLLSRMIRPQTILEIGTFTGYSAICLAKGLQPGGKLITIEADDELETFARSYFSRAGLAPTIDLRIGQARDIIPVLDGPFDLVFIDADKREYADYYQLVFDKIAPGGWILADNTLWNGKVLEKPDKQDEQTRGVLLFNEMIKNDERVEKVILPLRDGITIIRKK